MVPASEPVPLRKQSQEIAMTESKQPQPASPMHWPRPRPKARSSFPKRSSPMRPAARCYLSRAEIRAAYKFNAAHKVDTDPALLLPAVKPGQ